MSVHEDSDKKNDSKLQDEPQEAQTKTAQSQYIKLLVTKCYKIQEGEEESDV